MRVRCDDALLPGGGVGRDSLVIQRKRSLLSAVIQSLRQQAKNPIVGCERGTMTMYCSAPPRGIPRPAASE